MHSNVARRAWPTLLVGLTCSTLAAPAAAQDPAPRPIRPDRIVVPEVGGNGHAASWDGRLFVITRGLPTGDVGWAAQVLRPERVASDAEGRPRFDQGAFSPAVVFEAQASASGAGLALLNALALVPWPGVAENPYRSDAAGDPLVAGAYETYDLLVMTQRYRAGDDRLGRLRYRVVIAAPRTADARVERVARLSGFEELATTSGQPLRGIEPTVSFDGHLVVWQGHTSNDGRYDVIMYSYNQTPGAAAGWSAPRTISAMHLDKDVAVAGVRFGERFPLAEQPLRASDGQVYAAGEPFLGAYPWLSQDASEVVYTSTIAGQGAVRARRGGISIVGRLTGWIQRHVDGPLNPDREASVRLFTSSPGLTPGFWTPFRGATARRVPYTYGRPTYPIFSSNTSEYVEFDMSDVGDGAYVLALRMNEVVTRAGVIDPTRTPDTSGHARTGRLERGALFPQEVGLGDRSLGHVGQSIFFQDAGQVRVPAAPAPRDAITVTLWYRRVVDLDQDGENRYRILVHQPGSWYLILEETGQLHVLVITGGVQRRSGAVGTPLPVGTWGHAAFTYRASDGRLRVFSDGAVVFDQAFGAGALDPGAGDLLVGPAGQVPAAPFLPAGQAVLQLDEVFVSRIVRSDADVAAAAFRAPSATTPTTTPTTSIGAPLPLGLRATDLRVPAGAVTSAEAIALGERLFFDPRLSADGRVSCATCHDPARAFTDGLPTARGVNGRANPRNTPTVLNRAFSTLQFFDGRAASLEAQAPMPIEHPDEQGLPIAEAARRLAASPEYAQRFQRAFGRGPDRDTIGLALAAFQRTLLSGGSRADRFEAGEAAALTPAEQRGRALFHGKARCAACHVGSNYSDEAFHDTAQTPLGDPGRGGVTGLPADRGRFKTPTLRDVSRTAPYLHDGSVSTLEAVIDLYDRGGVRTAGRDIELRPLGLTAVEKAELAAFLRALDGVNTGRAAPTLPAGVPTTSGTSTGTGTSPGTGTTAGTGAGTSTTPTTGAGTAVSADARWLGRVYQALTGRAASAAEVDLHRRDLAAGGTAEQVVRDVLALPDAVNHRVAQVYRTYLRREPDAGGLASAASLLRSGKRVKDLETMVLVSAEYRTTRTTHEALVAAYYRDALGRDADPAGLAHFTGVVASHGPEVVARALLGSTERHHRFVDRAYRDLLGRAPDPAGLDASVRSLDQGLPLEDLLVMILSSSEMRARP